MVSHMENNQTPYDSIFHALADPTRRAVVQRLGRGDATVGALAEPFDMALPSFMKHVSVLERAGLIGTRKQGRVRTCTLNRERLIAAEGWFEAQRALWQARFDNLDLLLESLKGEEDDA